MVYGAPRTWYPVLTARRSGIVPPAIPNVPTVGEIARRLAVPIHKVEHVIRARGISPSGWAGNARVFSDENVSRIESQLRRIAAERETSHG